MCEMCIDNFLINCDASHVERHSDSSDFENSHEIPVVAPKDGNHSLLSYKTRKTKKEKDTTNRRLYDSFPLNSVDTKYDRNTVIKARQQKNKFLIKDKCVNCLQNCGEIDNAIRSCNNNRGDQTSQFTEKYSSPVPVKNKIVPCLSTILRRSNNCNTSSIRQNQTDIFNNNYCHKAYCANCERQRIKKFNRRREGYAVHPVYAVEENVTGFPFQKTNKCVALSQLDEITINNHSDLSYDCLSSGSELEYIKPHKHKKIMKHIMDRLEKRLKREYASKGTIKHQQQQYPSKLQLKSPYQIYASSSCQARCASTDSEGLSKMASHSSAFWDFLLQRMKYQIQKAEVSKDKEFEYSGSQEPCTPDSCDFFKAARGIIKQTVNQPIQCDSNNSKQNVEKLDQTVTTDKCCSETDPSSSESDTPTKKKSPKSEVICKCYPNKKRKSESKKGQPIPPDKDEVKPCQERHDIITKAISDKYKGEILCIHNPPCVLINGCLNLPPPKSTSSGQGNFWPVMQSKRSSFAQMCRKMKRSKQKTNDQANQYHPPCIDIQEYLPEFRTEKNVQSACNHIPPCEVVHGCQKMKYNPTLQNSCVHVPMCPKYPECLLENRNIDNKSCNHNPKCVELPLCSRKYIILTAKENASTQVKPKMKIACRHQPPCLMIPKCLAQAISGDYIPGQAIPGCVHEPSCEMIPACCRKQVKDLVSVPSQYPNASCRIV